MIDNDRYCNVLGGLLQLIHRNMPRQLWDTDQRVQAAVGLLDELQRDARNRVDYGPKKLDLMEWLTTPIPMFKQGRLCAYGGCIPFSACEHFQGELATLRVKFGEEEVTE